MTHRERMILIVGVMATLFLAICGQMATIQRYDKEIARRDALIASMQEDNGAKFRELEAAAKNDSESLSACNTALQRETSAENFASNWYIFLYEPAETAAAPDPALALLAAANPTLARLLSNPAIAQQSRTVTLRWILPKNGGMPIYAPPGSRTGLYTLQELSTAPKAVTQ